MQYYIRMQDFHVRKLNVEDWSAYRALRLEALSRNPEFFTPSRDETKFTEADWKERLLNPNAAAFGLYHAGELVGLSGIVREKNQADSPRAHMVSTYIREEYRGQGLSRLFYEARLAWARAQKDIKTLVLEHRSDNTASEKAHRRYGFQFKSSFTETYADKRPGSLTHVYELELY